MGPTHVRRMADQSRQTTVPTKPRSKHAYLISWIVTLQEEASVAQW